MPGGLVLPSTAPPATGEAWAAKANERLAELGHETRIDHRSLKDQAIELEPQNKIGPAGARREERGEAAERAAEHGAIAQRNGERIEADPNFALDALTHQHSTFTRQDLARLIDRHTDGVEQFTRVLAKVEASAEIVRLGEDDHGREHVRDRPARAGAGRCSGCDRSPACVVRSACSRRTGRRA